MINIMELTMSSFFIAGLINILIPLILLKILLPGF